MRFEQFYYKFVKKNVFREMMTGAWRKYVCEGMVDEEKSPTAIITSEILSRVFCIKSACLEIDDDECPFDLPSRCPWELNDFSDQSWSRLSSVPSYVCCSFPLPAIYCDCDAVILPRSSEDRVSITLSFQYSINQVAINGMHAW